MLDARLQKIFWQSQTAAAYLVEYIMQIGQIYVFSL